MKGRFSILRSLLETRTKMNRRVVVVIAVIFGSVLFVFFFLISQWQEVTPSLVGVLKISTGKQYKSPKADTMQTLLPKLDESQSTKQEVIFDTDLLIIIIDNRFPLLKNVINDYKSGNFTKYNINISSLGYNYYTFAINLMYGFQFNYSLIIVDIAINDNNTDTNKQNERVLSIWKTCQSRYYKLKPLNYVPMVWCKLDVLTYYLETEFIRLNSNEKLYYKWLVYLDSDSHFIPFDTSFFAWLQHINLKFNQSIEVLNLNANNIDINEQIQWIAVNDTPNFIKREKPRLQRAMQNIKDAQCDTYANAGILFMRKSLKSLEMMQNWGNTINQVPNYMIERFPREQGSLNCFISVKYAKYFYILPWFDEINLDRFIKYDSYLQHITSGYARYRMIRFPEFLRYLLNTQQISYDEKRKQKTTKLTYLKLVKLQSNQAQLDENVTIKAAVNQPHFAHSIQYGNLTFIENLFVFAKRV